MRQYEKFFYPESEFGGFTDIDGTIIFYTRVNALLQPSFTVLDVGCGNGSHIDGATGFKKNLITLQGKAARVIGIDVAEEATANQFIDEFRLIHGQQWPLDNNSIDLVVCDNVLEHIHEPDGFFSEIARVLRQGGVLCLRTPNLYNYIALAAVLIPNRLHGKVVAFAQNGRKEEDVFPTFYRCNSIGKLKRMLRKHGFADRVVYGYEAEPSYMSFSWLAYFFGVVHQKFVPSCFRATLFVFARKG